MPLPEVINKLRRRSAQLTDQVCALSYRKLNLTNNPHHIDINRDTTSKFALLTVNFHSTHYLKMMLLSLLEQEDLSYLSQLVVVDNGSRDGGRPFLRRLAEQSDRVLLVENRYWTNHARGMRLAQAALDQANALDHEGQSGQRPDLLLFCDPDVVFLRPDTLAALAALFADPQVTHAGELRTHLHPLPEAQASFLAVRRDWAARRDISPWVNHGSPAWWLQRDLIRRGGKAADFPGNKAGYILHRGRSAVAATRQFDPGHAYATARHHEPHFMGVPNGAATWNALEATHAHWLKKDRESELIEHLGARLS